MTTNNNINFTNITEKIIDIIEKKDEVINMNVLITNDLSSISGYSTKYNQNGEIVQEGKGMEADLEAYIIDPKYELEFQNNLKIESIETDFDLDVFKNIGLYFERSNNKLTLDFDKYNGVESGNYLQNFLIHDQLKIIKMYFKIESLRFSNQQIYEKSKSNEKMFHKLYIVVGILNIFIYYLSDIVDLTSANFSILSTIITMISYAFTRILMSTVANKTNFEQIQQALTKLRFTVETIIMGSYQINEDINNKTNNFISLQAKYKSDIDLYSLENGFNLNNILLLINKDLDSIYQFNSVFKEDNNIKKLLNIANTDSEKILIIFKTEITKAINKINKLKNDFNQI
jgi:hypothetical protein